MSELDLTKGRNQDVPEGPPHLNQICPEEEPFEGVEAHESDKEDYRKCEACYSTAEYKFHLNYKCLTC